jgi:hypothetical protein
MLVDLGGIQEAVLGSRQKTGYADVRAFLNRELPTTTEKIKKPELESPGFFVGWLPG